MAHETKADCGDCRPQHATRGRMEHARGHDHGKAWPDRKRERARADRANRKRAQEPCRAYRVDERTPGHLAGERPQPARSKDQADIELRPRMRGEVDGHKRAEASLDIGEKEREPVEAALAGRQIRALPRTPPPCEERHNTAAAAAIISTPVKIQWYCNQQKNLRRARDHFRPNGPPVRTPRPFAAK